MLCTGLEAVTVSCKHLACVAGVNGEGEGEQERGRRGTGGLGRGNACYKDPHFFISAAASGRKILIG